MPTSSSLPLARRGLPLVEIRLPAAPSAPEEFAAEELRRTLYEMIGAGPRLRTPHHRRGVDTPAIYLNDLEAARRAGITVPTLGREAFHLETRGGNLYLLGGGPRGVIYAVYELLDRLGCRWFTPEVSRIPRQPDLDLPALSLTSAPAFESRDTFNWACHDPRWWVRNRLNGWYTAVPEYMGGHVDYCGFVHTFYSLLPPDGYFDAHPEYYSLVAGQRRRDLGQLCLTNPDVLRIVTARVLELMRTHPQATIFSVSQNDCQGPCECPDCQAVVDEEGSQSGPILWFASAVAAETAKIYPDKLIDTLAYWYSLDAPRHAVPHPNVRVRLCSISSCMGHPYQACAHPESARFLRALDEWGNRTSQLYIWHYATDFTHYPLPMPDLDELHGNINLYHRYGAHGLFIQSMGEEGGGAESLALRGYVVSRLLWQPQQPVWPIVDEFLGAYYGAAAPLVRRYLDIFHDRVRQDKDLHPSLYDLPSARQFDDDLRLPAEQALAEAEKLVRGEQRQRVRLLRGGLRYIRLFRASKTFQREGDAYHGAAAPEHLQEFEKLARLWQRAGVQHIREGEAFDFSLHRLRSRLVSHPVAWLEQGDQRIAVVFSLGGRLLEWHARGRQWLAPAGPDSTWSVHPFSGGYTDFAVLGMYATRGWGEPYRFTWRGQKLALTVYLEQALRLTRTLWLEDGRLHIHSRLTNRGAAPFPCGWGASLGLALPAEGEVRFTSQAGERIIPWEALPPAGLALTDDQLPSGAWLVRAGSFTLHQEYQGAPLGRFSLGKGEAGRLTIELRTESLTLAQGESLTARQELWIE
jgi:Domain of unknown function (DUF4838)/Glycosyl hydrolase family 67 N-terminus